MKKGMIIVLGACLLMSSCGSYEATGAYTGGQFGHVLGSAIGGLAGGWRGHEIGSIVGTIGGAAAGAAIGAAHDRAQQQRYEDRVAAVRSQQARQRESVRSNGGYDQQGYGQQGYDQQGYDQSGYDPQMRGDDRIVFDDGQGTTQGYGQSFATTTGPALAIRNAGIYEDLRDGQIEVRIGVAQGNNVIKSLTRQFFVPTTKRMPDSARR